MHKVIDLFSGAGGFSIGFVKCDYNLISAVEYDSSIAETYKLNHPSTKMYNIDIQKLDYNLNFKKNDADIIIGGPPCQGFSMAGARNRNGFIDDPRNYLFKHYYEIVKLVRPKIFILENVKGLLSSKGGAILNEIKNIFEDPNNFDGLPYKIQYKVLNSKDFGIPQKRERVFLFGSLHDFILDKEILETKEYITRNVNANYFNEVSTFQAISNLPDPNEAGIVKIKYGLSEYQNYLSSLENITYNHIATKHKTNSIRRIKSIKIDENFKVLNEDIKSIHSGSYGRLNPETFSPTITTRFDTPSGGRFIHPFKDRTITPREAARLQSFPDDFIFVGSKTSINKQIGNAVPPKLSYFLACMVKRILCAKKTPTNL